MPPSLTAEEHAVDLGKPFFSPIFLFSHIKVHLMSPTSKYISLLQYSLTCLWRNEISPHTNLFKRFSHTRVRCIAPTFIVQHISILQYSLAREILNLAQFLDAIASSSDWVSESVSQWVMFSDFGDCYRIYRACELVLLQNIDWSE